MRNSLPPLGYTQKLENAVAGLLGVACEAQNASLPGYDEWHTLSSDALSLPPMDPYGPPPRGIDIFSLGPNFTTSTSAPTPTRPRHHRQALSRDHPLPTAQPTCVSSYLLTGPPYPPIKASKQSISPPRPP